MFKKKLLPYWPKSFASISSCSATRRSVDLAFVAFETILHVLPWSDRCLLCLASRNRRAPALPNHWLLLVLFIYLVCLFPCTCSPDRHIMILSSVIFVTHHYISEGIEASVCSIIIYITVLASVKSRCIFSLWLIPLNKPSVSRRVPYATKPTSWFVLINFCNPHSLRALHNKPDYLRE